MNYKKMLVGDYIAAVELDDKQPTMTIRAIKSEMMEQIGGGKKDDADEGDEPGEKSKKKKKWIIVFKETDRGWVLNRTNILCLAAMFGEDNDSWIGKRVTICAEMVKLKGKQVLGIRIKGSPDITAAVSAVIELPRRKPVTMRLMPTGKTEAQEATS